jgi:tRNA A37 threonylcarbamoyladenosine synthetase subunit TsaC/SUA5/YrdC
MNPAYVDQLSVAQARMIVEVLRRGGVVWYMSDCGYALGADPRHPVGVAALDALLDHAGHPIPVTVADESLAALVVRFDDTVRLLTGKFWPGGLGLHTKASTRLGRLLARRLHAKGGVVVRVSRSAIERQISATARMPITSAALRVAGVLVTNTEMALAIAVRLHEERTPGLRTIFVRDLRRRVPLHEHSTMLSVIGGQVTTLRPGSVDLSDVQRTVASNHGVDWGDAT